MRGGPGIDDMLDQNVLVFNHIRSDSVQKDVVPIDVQQCVKAVCQAGRGQGL